MRFAAPCSAALDQMPQTADGAHCTECDRDVVDLRRVRRGRALAVIESLRQQGDGRVCVRARVTPAGVPVFAPDPSRLARLLGPVALAGSLAACSPASQVASHATPVTLVSGYSGNGNDQPPPRRVPVARVAPPAVHPTPTSTNPIEPHEEWAGMMVME